MCGLVPQPSLLMGRMRGCVRTAFRTLSGHCEAANGSRARLQHNMT